MNNYYQALLDNTTLPVEIVKIIYRYTWPAYPFLSDVKKATEVIPYIWKLCPPPDSQTYKRLVLYKFKMPKCKWPQKFQTAEIVELCKGSKYRCLNYSENRFVQNCRNHHKKCNAVRNAIAIKHNEKKENAKYNGGRKYYPRKCKNETPQLRKRMRIDAQDDVMLWN